MQRCENGINAICTVCHNICKFYLNILPSKFPILLLVLMKLLYKCKHSSLDELNKVKIQLDTNPLKDDFNV